MSENENSSRSVSLETLAGAALVLAIIIAGVALAIWSTWEPGVIVGFLAGIAGIGVPVLVQLRATRQVHTMVNQQASDAKAYSALLQRTLTTAGVKVPADQSLPAQAAPGSAIPGTYTAPPGKGAKPPQ